MVEIASTLSVFELVHLTGASSVSSKGIIYSASRDSKGAFLQVLFPQVNPPPITAVEVDPFFEASKLIKGPPPRLYNQCTNLSSIPTNITLCSPEIGKRQ